MEFTRPRTTGLDDLQLFIRQQEELDQRLTSFGAGKDAGNKNCNRIIFEDVDSPPPAVTLMKLEPGDPQPQIASFKNRGATDILFTTVFAAGSRVDVISFRGALTPLAATPLGAAGGKLSEQLPIPQKGTFNRGLTAVSEQTMLNKFGRPGQLTSDCSEPSAHLEPLLVRDVDVGPFKVDGLKFAVDSLKQVFDEVKKQFPAAFSQARTDGLGMLCVRHRRPNPTAFSNHSWGTAIDLKFGDQEIDQGTPLTQRGFLSLFPIFNKFGWFWGAGFSGGAVDSMHFELAEETIRNLN
jgi:D-alanyl-D-alanine carboxypeptidase